MADLTKQETAALSAIETLEDPVKLRALMGNARRLGSATVERAAFTRLCAVQPSAEPGSIAFAVWQSIHALEEMLLEERGRTTRLTRTRQKITRDGEEKTVADLTLKAEPSAGFTDLIARGHPELTFEAVVLAHPETFEAPVIDAARTRLTEAGVETAAPQN